MTPAARRYRQILELARPVIGPLRRLAVVVGTTLCVLSTGCGAFAPSAVTGRGGSLFGQSKLERVAAVDPFPTPSEAGIE